MAFRYVLLLALVPAVLGGGKGFEEFVKMYKASQESNNEQSGSNNEDYGGWGENDGWKSWSGWKKPSGFSGWGGMKFMMKGKMQPMMNPMMMMQQMQQMQQQQQMQQNQQQNNWMQEQNQEHIEAYTRWCQEKEERALMMQSRRQFVEWMEKNEEKRQQELRKAKMEVQAKEHAEKIRQQYEQWKIMFSQQQHFETLLHKFKYMKAEYMSSMMMELLKFCKCNDVNSKLSKYFTMQGGNSTMTMGMDTEGTMFDLEEMEHSLEGEVGEVAVKIIGLSQEEKTKLFFGSAVSSLCDGAKDFAADVKSWEMRYSLW